MFRPLHKHTLPSCALAVFGATIVACLQGGSLVREGQTVVVDSGRENWRLEWRTPPKLVCFPGADDGDWYTCPCAGFEFGEQGALDLVRRTPGGREERLPLAPLFQDTEHPGSRNEAVLRRWPLLTADTLPEDPGLAGRVRERPPAAVMMLADFDRDGRSTEFLFRVGTEPCAHIIDLLIGISRDRPTLHLFTSAEHPERPLILDEPVWEGLLRSPRGVATVVDQQCGDHGSDQMTEVALQALHGVLHATRRAYECTNDGKRGRLVSAQVL